MKKVLIVEDEKTIRQGIREMISRCGIPIEQIIECKNGLEALEIICNDRIDVMVTDIRMPRMDGITLVKEMQKYLYVPKIIVISGYDDFSFAVDLLRCGAREYLLKPIKREEIKTIMEKLEEEIQKESDEKENKKEYCYGQLRMLLSTDTMTREEIDEIEACICIEKGEEYRIICTNYHMTDKCMNEKVFFFSNIEGSNAILISSDKSGDFMKNTLFGYRIGVSECHWGLYDLRKAFQEARERRISAFCMQEQKEGRESEGYQISLNELECFVQRIGTSRVKENDRYLNEIVSHVKSGDIDGKRFQETIHQIVSRVKDFYGGILLTEGIHIENLHDMLAFDNIDDYCMEFHRIFSEINQKALNECDDYRNRMKVEQAIAYIKENYGKDINMAIVSNHVSMNYTVFSIAFKEYTGENFVNYLKNIRLKEAKRLLEETDQKIMQISTMVGYDNEKHFMKTFKSIVGVTPSEYRKNAWIRK